MWFDKISVEFTSFTIGVFKVLGWSEVSYVETYIQNIGASTLKLVKTKWKSEDYYKI